MTLYQVRYSGALPTSEAYDFNVWFSSANTLSQMVTDATTWINTAWGATSADGIQSALNTTTTLTRVHVGTITQATGIQTTAAAATLALAGAVLPATAVPCPPDIAMCVSLTTQFTGVSFRGRFRLPVPHVDMLTTLGELDSTKLGVVADGIQDAYNAISGTCTAVLYRRTSHQVENITEFNMPELPSSISRRINKTINTRIVRTL